LHAFGALGQVEPARRLVWSGQRRLDYVQWAHKVVAGLRGTNAMLEELFDETDNASCDAESSS